MANVSIGLALGGGVARGWCHIGVMRTLIQAGFEPDIIAGTSIGAVVGGLYLAGKLDDLEIWARSLNRAKVRALMDVSLRSGGLIAGARLKALLDQYAGGILIEHLTRNFAAVATELSTGHEIWLRDGELTQALRASYALPGVFPAVNIDGRYYVDGALTDPVPTAAARAMGARLVIGVGLHVDGQLADDDLSEPGPFGDSEEGAWSDWIRPDRIVSRLIFGKPKVGPGISATMTGALNIMLDRLTRMRLAADPADVMIEPDVSHIGLLEFDRADELIALGGQAAERALPMIERLALALD
ncbi:putative NTE family protein [Alphaproteobacteria bacterium SO-S41]|nr:putative NTE family protein [Alphaproteobacteria bacterium SO-S41]